MNKRIPFERVNWTTSSFLIGTVALCLTALPLYLWNYGFDPFLFGLAFFYFIATGLSITLGYHRLFAHAAFKAKWPVKVFTLVFGAAAFENSVLDWASDHRRHHKHVDHDDDPYDINKGFFYAHIGWLLFKLKLEGRHDNANDLKRDPLVVWQHRWVHLVGLIVGFLVPTLIGYLHNGAVGALGGFLIPGVLRVVAVQHCTFFINSLCHTIGSRPYNTGNSARDSWIMAIFTFGEGYHNYHHMFQHDYRNGVKAWQFDPTKWTIWTLSKVGLADKLRRVPEEKILMAELKEANNRINSTLSRPQPETVSAKWEEYKADLENMYTRINELYDEVQESVKDRMELSRKKIEEFRNEIHIALQAQESFLKMNFA